MKICAKSSPWDILKVAIIRSDGMADEDGCRTDRSCRASERSLQFPGDKQLVPKIERVSVMEIRLIMQWTENSRSG
eukprot:scaffold3078_cov83-Skeletonema_dohrnii-CCMP3373.AAC.2